MICPYIDKEKTQQNTKTLIEDLRPVIKSGFYDVKKLSIAEVEKICDLTTLVETRVANRANEIIMKLLLSASRIRLKNILKRDFDPSSPDAAWCTDITYIWTYDDGFVYLTSVMDLFSRKIVSWVLTKDMTAESVLEAIKIAQERRNIEKPVIIHSDREIQFTSELYKEITEKMKRSYNSSPHAASC